MKLWKSVLSLLAVAAVTLTATAFAGQPGSSSEPTDGMDDSFIYEDEFDTRILFELPEETKEPSYTAYTIFSDSILMVNDNGQYHLAYCYNHRYSAPALSTGTEYSGKEHFEGQGHDAENTKTLQKQVEALLHVGYPYDAMGYRATYGGDLNDDTVLKSRAITEEVAATIEEQGYTFTTGDYLAASATQEILWQIAEGGLGDNFIENLRENAKKDSYAAYELALYEYAVKGEVPSNTQVVFKGLDTETNQLGEIVLTKAAEKDYYESNPIICQAYNGEIELELPDGFEAYVMNSSGDLTLVEAGGSIKTSERFVLRCTSETAAQEFNDGAPLQFKGNYGYKTVEEFFIYKTDKKAAGKPYQNLFSFTEAGDTSVGTFTISKESGGFEPGEPDNGGDTSSETTSSDTSSETTSSDTSSETTSSDTSSETTSSDTSSETTSSDTSSETPSQPVTPPESETPSEPVTPPTSSDVVEIPDETVPTTSGTVAYNPPAGNEDVDFPQESTLVIDEENVPLASAPQELMEIADEDVPLANIEDEDVPLGREPQTGDNTHNTLAAGLLVLSLGGMTVLALAMRRLSRKEKEED